jgi:hypothetical protein
MIAFFVLILLALPHPHDESELSRAYKVKPNGEIDLVDDTMIRETLLPRGKYLVGHRLDGATHSIVFTQVPDKKRPAQAPVTVAASVVPAKAAVSQSMVLALPPEQGQAKNKYFRIMRVDIAGESFEHLL